MLNPQTKCTSQFLQQKLAPDLGSTWLDPQHFEFGSNLLVKQVAVSVAPGPTDHLYQIGHELKRRYQAV